MSDPFLEPIRRRAKIVSVPPTCDLCHHTATAPALVCSKCGEDAAVGRALREILARTGYVVVTKTGTTYFAGSDFLCDKEAPTLAEALRKAKEGA